MFHKFMGCVVMVMITDYFCSFSSLLFSKAKAGSMIIISAYLCAGIFISLSSALYLREFLESAAFSLSLAGRILLIYFTITVLFASGLSQAGFAVIPLLSLLMGIVVSFILYTGKNGSVVTFIFSDISFAALLMLTVISYGAYQLKTSWQFFTGFDSVEVLDTLQLNIKLYYFTLAVFALMTAVISGLGYIIPFLYRSLL